MGGSNLSVKITADTASLVSEMAVAKAKLSEYNATLRDSVSASLKFGESNAAASQSVAQAAENVARAQARLAGLRAEMRASTSATSSFGGALEDVRSKISGAFAITGIGIAAEGVMKLGEAISQLGDRAIEIQTMSEVLGVTTDQFQAMSVAAEEAGVPVNVFVRAGEKLTNLLTEARDGSAKAIEKLLALGITTGEIGDKTFQLNDVLAVLKERLQNTNTAEETRKTLLQELGARMATAIPAIKDYDGSQQGAAAAMSRVNGLMPEQIARLKEVKTWWGEVGTAIGNTSSKFLIYLADSAKAYGAAELQMTRTDDDDRTDNRSRPFGSMGEGEGAAATAREAAENARVQEAAHRDALHDEMEKIKEGVAAFASGTAERLAALRQYAADAKQYYGSGDVDEVRKANQEVLVAQREFQQTQSREAIAAAKEQVQALQADTSLSFSQRLDAEREIWTGVLASDKVGSAQRLEAAREFSREYVEIAKQTAAEAAAVTRSDASADVAIEKIRLEAKRSALQQDLQESQVTAAQKLAIMRQLAAESFSLDMKVLESELSTLREGTGEYERVYNQIRELKAKLVADLEGYDSQYQRDLAKQLKEQTTQWKTAVGEIQNAEGTLVADILGRRKTMAQSIEQIGVQMLQTEISNDLKALTSKVLLQNQEKALEQGGFLFHQTMELLKAGVTKTQTAAQTAAVTAGQTAQNSSLISGAAAGKAVQAASGPAQVMADAAEAFAGAFAATAAIPYIGPELAPAAGAEAFAAVASMAGAASLDVGTNYVPRDMLAMIHEGEAVTPKEYNPAAGGGEGGGGGYTEVHNYNGHTYASALDTRGLSSLLKGPGNRRAIAMAARQYFSRGGGRR
jgi:hypothetical protein